MNRKVVSRVVLVLVLAALLATGAWFYKTRAERTVAAANSSQQVGSRPAIEAGTSGAAGAPVASEVEFLASDLYTLAPQRLTRSIPLTGTLRPVNQTVVKTKVQGELRELTVREGTSVRRGQLLGRLDLTEYEVRVKEREAQLKSAESQVDQTLRTLENTRQLKEKNFVSQSALDASRSAWEVAVGNRDAAAAQATLARKSLADAVLIAPIDGVVAERFAQPGEKLPIDGRVLSIVDLSKMEIEAPVPAAEIGSVKIGQSVELRIEGVSTRQVGRIVRIAPATQAGTRSVPIYIALDNRDPSVRAGLFAQGVLAIDQRDGVLAIPIGAVRDAGGRTFVYAIANDKLIERDIKLGLRDETGGDGTRVEVVSGLNAGDRIVATNLGSLRAGSTVRVVAAAQR
jgi:membrane fusion protein, multidrug efflux system